MLRQKADRQSPETRAAGLPKAIKLLMSVDDNAPAAATWVNTRFNTIPFNYGPYQPSLDPLGLAGWYGGVIVSEPGIYRLFSAISCTANSQAVVSSLCLNNANVAANGHTFRDGSINESYTGATDSNGTSFGIHTCTYYGELLAGDYITVAGYQSVGPQVWKGGRTQLYIQKEGGQY